MSATGGRTIRFPTGGLPPAAYQHKQIVFRRPLTVMGCGHEHLGERDLARPFSHASFENVVKSFLRSKCHRIIISVSLTSTSLYEFVLLYLIWRGFEVSVIIAIDIVHARGGLVAQTLGVRCPCSYLCGCAEIYGFARRREVQMPTK